MTSKKLFCLLGLTVFSTVTATAQTKVSIVERPDISPTNSFYLGHRAPLEPARFIALPPSAVKPRGWLQEVLNRQRDGLCGHLGEISVWLQKDGNAWLSRDGKGKYGWEELPYWLRGYIQMGYTLNDPNILKEARIWIEGALNSQRENGDFGPDQKFDNDGSRDFWANMLMMWCLQSYYEESHDQRVIDLMTRYFHYQLTVPDDKFLTHYWQKMRGGDNLLSVYWLYDRTGDAELLKLADKIHRCTANWEMKDNLPNWHNVNIAECFREPAEHFLQTHDKAELDDTYADFCEIRKRYGQVPGGMYGGDENSRPGHTDPHQAVETCGMVEQMLSDDLLMQISGDPFWADQCEDVAFNTYPAALMPDMRSLRYLTAPNMVVSDSKNHAPGLQNEGPFLMMNPFSSRCCQHNHSMGWPYFTKQLWVATPDNGICAAVYSPCDVSAKVGDGEVIHIEEETKYPFEEKIHLTIHADKPVNFPLYLRLPAWCKNASIRVNGKNVLSKGSASGFARIERTWKNKDVVTMELPMDVSIHNWPANHDCVSVDYGPLTFSLKIGERLEQKSSLHTAMSDSGWQKNADPSKWPSFEIYPTTPWNYGLVLDAKHPERSFSVKRSAWPKDNFPFTPDSCPIQLTARAKQIPQWTLDKHELAGVLQDSPVASDKPMEKVTLIPMGAARLRISSFPVIGNNANAHQWAATK